MARRDSLDGRSDEALLSLTDWISGYTFPRYTGLQSLIKCLDHRGPVLLSKREPDYRDEPGDELRNGSPWDPCATQAKESRRIAQPLSPL